MVGWSAPHMAPVIRTRPGIYELRSIPGDPEVDHVLHRQHFFLQARAQVSAHEIYHVCRMLRGAQRLLAHIPLKVEEGLRIFGEHGIRGISLTRDLPIPVLIMKPYSSFRFAHRRDERSSVGCRSHPRLSRRARCDLLWSASWEFHTPDMRHRASTIAGEIDPLPIRRPRR